MNASETTPDYPKILFFSSKHCTPCKPVEERLDRINLSMFGKKLIIEKINIDIKTNRDLIMKYKITSVPTLIIGSSKLMVNIDDSDIIDAILQAYVDSVKI
ncbi:MAG: Thioredoxin [Promethearchaeota archaeon]|nr:MAG: Thioredoxin [Candidatus Lokiarchaeota archaeon]